MSIIDFANEITAAVRGSACGNDDPIERVGPRLGVSSEVGELRRVILHRPGFELTRLPRARSARLPRREVARVMRVRAEHDAFADALAGHGVEVLYLNDLLVETLELGPARHEVIARSLETVERAPRLRSALVDVLGSLGPLELAARLVGGLSAGELEAAHRRKRSPAPSDGGLVLSPLADSLLARRSSAWVMDGVLLGTAADASRRRTSIHLEAIYRHHPGFANLPRQVWTAGPGGPARIDGDDVFVLGDGCVLVGLSERTGGSSAALLADRLLDAEAASRAIVVSRSAGSGGTGLDAGFAMVDRATFVVRSDLVQGLAIRTFHSKEGEFAVEQEPDLFTAIERALDPEPVRFLELAGGPAAGVLAIAPGTVLTFDSDDATNDVLRRAGLEVIAVPGAELGRYRATPRRLACPIERDPVPPV